MASCTHIEPYQNRKADRDGCNKLMRGLSPLCVSVCVCVHSGVLLSGPGVCYIDNLIGTGKLMVMVVRSYCDVSFPWCVPSRVLVQGLVHT